MEEEDVERVGLDPLAAIHQSPKHPDPLVDLDPERVLHRVEGAGHVGDRADPADPRGDVGRLSEVPAAQEGLEEARRLVDLELDVLDLAVADPDLHRALALDPGERLGPDRPGLALLSHRPRRRSLSSLNGSRAVWKVR